MLTLTLVFLLVALLCFAAASFGIAAGKLNLIAAGLFFTTLCLLVQQMPTK